MMMENRTTVDPGQRPTINQITDDLGATLYEIEGLVRRIGDQLFGLADPKETEELKDASVIGRLGYTANRAHSILKKISDIANGVSDEMR